MEIYTTSTMDAWRQALQTIKEHGHVFEDNDNRRCHECFHMTITIEQPQNFSDQPIDRLRKFEKWLYPDKEELISIITEKESSPLYEFTYGSRLFSYRNSIDQIHNYVIPLLRKNPHSRRASVIVVDPVVDLRINQRNTPSLLNLQFRISENKLLLTSVIRSNDIFMGWPTNVYQLSELQRMVAEALQVEQGALTTFSVSAHIFEDQFNDINTVLEEKTQ